MIMMNVVKNSSESRVINYKELDAIKLESNSTDLIIRKTNGMERMNRVAKTEKFKQLDIINSEPDITTLMRSIAKSTSIVTSGVPVKKYLSIYKHPLPISKHRYHHEVVLKRVMSCTLDKQVYAAVVSRDAYTLEEVYMQGAAVNLKNPLNGFTPLHLAVQGNDIDCVKMLLHIGVDVNTISLSGCTPLYLVKAKQAEEIGLLLIKHGAKLYNDPPRIYGTTILASNAPNMKASALVLPPVGSRRPTDMRKRHASY
jgi:hypothetical protein